MFGALDLAVTLVSSNPRPFIAPIPSVIVAAALRSLLLPVFCPARIDCRR
jgi:hypothetical protein